MFFQDHDLTYNFFQQRLNRSVAKNESTSTVLSPEATPAITATPNDSHGSHTVEEIGTVSGNTFTPTQPAPGNTALELMSLDKIMNWITENPYKVAGLVAVCFSGGTAYYSYKHSARFH